MKHVILFLWTCVLLGCNAQEKQREPKKTEDEEGIGIQPKEMSKVRKEFDELGNLIRYDSIYSWSYSNMEGDSITVNLDSIMNSFKNHFRELPFKWNEDFLYFPESDSLFMNDFFKDDYFRNYWERHPVDIEKIIKQMDSTRNEFLKRFHPGLMESFEEKEPKS